MRSDSFSFCSTNSVIYSSHQLCHLFHQLCHLFKLENLVSLLPTQLDVSGHGGPLVSPAPSGLKLIRGAFFSRGSGVFHGTLNPLSSRSIIECCVFPCLLSGAEAWILNDTLIRQLESVQAELAKRILILPRRISNNVTRMALQWPSMRARILIIKLSFLLRVSRDNRSLSSWVFRSLATSEVESLIIVRQCRFLESPLQSNFTSSVLASPKHISITSMKKR